MDREYLQGKKDLTLPYEGSLENLDKLQLWDLRKDIILNSIYIADYENSLDIDPDDVYNFFNGWLEYIDGLIEEDMCNRNIDLNTLSYWDEVKKYDNIDCLWNYYNIIY